MKTRIQWMCTKQYFVRALLVSLALDGASITAVADVQATVISATGEDYKHDDGMWGGSHCRLPVTGVAPAGGRRSQSMNRVADAHGSKSREALSRRLRENRNIQLELLRSKPLELKVNTIEGVIVDIAEWRGSVIIIEFWTTRCSSCITGLARIKEVYDKYHSSGLKVLGIAFDEASRRDGVIDILEKLGIEWVNVLEPWAESALPKRLHIKGFPTTLIVDKYGFVVTNDINNGVGPKLEMIVRELLGLPANMPTT